MISFFTEHTAFPLKIGSKTKIRGYIDKLIKTERKQIGDLNIIFCSDEYILQINKQYLQHNYFTDVITFDYSDSPTISGDIFISIDTVKNNAIDFTVAFEEELYRVIFHGVLHLCGYNDKSESEKALMRDKENFYLSFVEKY